MGNVFMNRVQKGSDSTFKGKKADRYKPSSRFVLLLVIYWRPIGPSEDLLFFSCFVLLAKIAFNP